MQSLWARAGQAHRCGCRACSTAVGAAGKRATGAAGRRKATFAEIFTACYSSVFATAAVVDAVRKDERRRELDRQLEEARRELNELKQSSTSDSLKADVNAPELSITQMDTLWKSLKTIYRNRPFMKEIDKPVMMDSSELVAELKQEYYNAMGEPSLRWRRRIDYEQLERAIMAEERDKSIAFRESLNQAHILHESRSIEDLVQQLLKRAELLDQSSKSSPSFDEAKILAEGGYPKFAFRSVDPDTAFKNTLALNSQIRSLVNTENLSWKEKIGRVCYNLLVSAHPPDMHTYNTLIVAFDKSGQHALSEALVYSFYHRRLLKPTPSTFTAILNHYKVTGNHGQFLRTLACLTGLDRKSGGKMGRRHIKDIEHWGMEAWAANTKLRTRTGAWVWEHVPLNVPLVETILNGLLHFRLYDEAASLFVSCVRSGVTLSARAVRQLFDECVSALDWRAAVRLVRGLSNSPKRWEAFLSQEDKDTTAHLVGRLLALLDLSGLGNYSHQSSERCLAELDISGTNLERFLTSLSKASLVLPEASWGSFQAPDISGCTELTLSKSRLLQLESIWKEYDFVQKTTASIESKLLYPEFSSTFRTSMAMHIGTTAVEKSLMLAQELEVLLPPNGSLSPRSMSAFCDEQVAKDESLADEMRAMNVTDDGSEKPQEEHGRQETAMASESVSRWSRKQDEVASGGIQLKQRGLLAWQQSPRRAVYAEGRQWAVGT